MTETSFDLLQAGRLAEAVPAALEAVKKQPADAGARAHLAELLCFAGDLERADKQLETLGQLSPQALLGTQIFRQLIRAEFARAECFNQGRVPEFLFEPSPVLQLHLRACISLRAGNAGEAAEILEQAEAARPHVSGTWNGEPFDDLRDLDDLTASFFEVVSADGSYYWVPFERVEAVKVQVPKRPSDLLWRPVRLTAKDGPEGDVFLPAIYAATVSQGDDQLRLGRGTSWFGGEGAPVRGLGLRTFLVGDQDRTLHELRDLQIQAS